MANIVEHSLARSVQILGDVIDSQRQEIELYRQEIIGLRAINSQLNAEQTILKTNMDKVKQFSFNLECANKTLKEELELHEIMVSTLEDELLQAGVAPSSTR